MTNHTPGPWEVGTLEFETSLATWECHIYANKAPMGRRLPAIIIGESREEVLANAQVVAAATELLAVALSPSAFVGVTS